MITIKDYTKMTIKENEKDCQELGQKMMDLITKGASKEEIDYASKEYQCSYEQLQHKYRKRSKMEG